MEKEFIPYEQALTLKELGFDEPCLGFYDGKGNTNLYFNKVRDASGDFKPFVRSERLTWFGAPTFSQAFRWFREKFDYHHTIQHNKKYVGIAYSSVVNFSIDEFNTYEEAELDCLKELIKIVKNK